MMLNRSSVCVNELEIQFEFVFFHTYSDLLSITECLLMTGY